MNTISTTTKTAAMNLDLALGNGGKANKAVRGAASDLVYAVFNGAVTPAMVEKAKMVETKSTSPEIVSLLKSLLATF